MIKSLEDAPLQVMSCQSCTTENIPLLLRAVVLSLML